MARSGKVTILLIWANGTSPGTVYDTPQNNGVTNITQDDDGSIVPTRPKLVGLTGVVLPPR